MWEYAVKPTNYSFLSQFYFKMIFICWKGIFLVGETKQNKTKHDIASQDKPHKKWMDGKYIKTLFWFKLFIWSYFLGNAKIHFNSKLGRVMDIFGLHCSYKCLKGMDCAYLGFGHLLLNRFKHWGAQRLECYCKWLFFKSAMLCNSVMEKVNGESNLSRQCKLNMK